MDNRPKFQGNPRDEADLLRYERELRAWEESKAEAEHYDELYKAEPELPLAEQIAVFLDDPGTRDKLRGPDGLPGMNGAPGGPGEDGAAGAAGADGADGADGSDWRTGSGAPSIVAGDNEGDHYINDVNGEVYVVESGVWDGPLFSLQGPAGADGTDAELSKILYTIAGTGSPSLTITDQPVDTLIALHDTTAGELTIVSDEVVVGDSGAGTYLISFHIEIQTEITLVGASQNEASAQIARDVGAGFVLQGPTVIATNYGTSFGDTSLVCQPFPITLAVGDKLILTATHQFGTDVLRINERNTFMTIQKVASA